MSSLLEVPFLPALKAEALHRSGRGPEALEAISEAEAVAERSNERWWYAELNRFRGVFLAALGANETQIENSFCEGIRIAREQKSISLTKRAEATYSEYRRQKASGSKGATRIPTTSLASAHETENVVHLGVPEDIRLKAYAPEADYRL